jgi:hypothetical protein
MEKRSTETKPIEHETTVERKSERELVVTRPMSSSVLGPNPNCSSGGGHRSRLECPSFPARPMFVRGARTVSCSVTPPRSSLCHFSVGTSK